MIFIANTLLLHDFVRKQYGRLKIRNLVTVNDLDRKIRIYLVVGTQDGTYATGDNSNCLRGIQVHGLDQHKNGHLHMHSVVLPAPML